MVQVLTVQEGRVVLAPPAGVEVVGATPVWVVGELFEGVMYYQREGEGPRFHQLARVGHQAAVEMVTLPPVFKHFLILMYKYECGKRLWVLKITCALETLPKNKNNDKPFFVIFKNISVIF